MMFVLNEDLMLLSCLLVTRRILLTNGKTMRVYWLQCIMAVTRLFWFNDLIVITVKVGIILTEPVAVCDGSGGHQPTYVYNTASIPAYSFSVLLQPATSSNPIQFTNTEFGQCYFCYCSSKIWNKIPAIIEASATGATIKLRLKSHFLSQSLKQSISVRLATSCTSSLRFPQDYACYKLGYYYYCWFTTKWPLFS